MVKIAIMVLVGLLLVGLVFFITDEDEYISTDEDGIRIVEELYREGIKNQLPIEEQIDELKRIDIKLYGKEISDYDAIRDKYNSEDKW